MEIHIKNMVCDRCIMTVSAIFKEAGIDVEKVELGKVSLKNKIDTEILKQIDIKLKEVGFEIVKDSKSRLIEQIKIELINYVYQNKLERKVNFSDYLVDKIHLDYSYLSSIFSSVEGRTIEKYLIKLKIERVKELLLNDEKTISEIALEMGYSSVAHLSAQFKRVTGISPSNFKQAKKQNRKSIDNI